MISDQNLAKELDSIDQNEQQFAAIYSESVSDSVLNQDELNLAQSEADPEPAPRPLSKISSPALMTTGMSPHMKVQHYHYFVKPGDQQNQDLHTLVTGGNPKIAGGGSPTVPGGSTSSSDVKPGPSKLKTAVEKI